MYAHDDPFHWISENNLLFVVLFKVTYCTVFNVHMYSCFYYYLNGYILLLFSLSLSLFLSLSRAENILNRGNVDAFAIEESQTISIFFATNNSITNELKKHLEEVREEREGGRERGGRKGGRERGGREGGREREEGVREGGREGEGGRVTSRKVQCTCTCMCDILSYMYYEYRFLVMRMFWLRPLTCAVSITRSSCLYCLMRNTFY